MKHSDTSSSDQTHETTPAQKLEWHRPQLRELDIAGKTASGNYPSEVRENTWYYTTS